MLHYMTELCFPPLIPGPLVSPDLIVLAAVVLCVAIRRTRLPEWLVPVRGRWLRAALTGVTVAAACFAVAVLLNGAWVPMGGGVNGLLPWQSGW